jgi:hypothetical protein
MFYENQVWIAFQTYAAENTTNHILILHVQEGQSQKNPEGLGKLHNLIYFNW